MSKWALQTVNWVHLSHPVLLAFGEWACQHPQLCSSQTTEAQQLSASSCSRLSYSSLVCFKAITYAAAIPKNIMRVVMKASTRKYWTVLQIRQLNLGLLVVFETAHLEHLVKNFPHCLNNTKSGVASNETTRRHQHLTSCCVCAFDRAEGAPMPYSYEQQSQQ